MVHDEMTMQDSLAWRECEDEVPVADPGFRGWLAGPRAVSLFVLMRVSPGAKLGIEE